MCEAWMVCSRMLKMEDEDEGEGEDEDEEAIVRALVLSRY